MIAEAEIENAIAAAFTAQLSALSAPTPRIVKSWEALADGEVKGQADASAATIAIAAGIRQYDSFCSPQADIPCSVAISVRRDADPTAATFAAVIEPILDLCHIWNQDVDEAADELSTASFDIGGFRLSSGRRQITQDAFSLSLDFTLRGVIKTPTNN